MQVLRTTRTGLPYLKFLLVESLSEDAMQVLDKKHIFVLFIYIIIKCILLQILLQMHRSGELVDELQKVGIRSALLDAETKE